MGWAWRDQGAPRRSLAPSLSSRRPSALRTNVCCSLSRSLTFLPRMGPLRKHKKGKARPPDGAGPSPSAPTPSDQAALLRRLESHARAFFGEEEEESEEDACAPPSASRPPHVAPVPAADSDASTNDDSSYGEGETSSSSEDEEEGARGAHGGAHGAPPPPTRRPPVVVVAGPSGSRRAAPPATAAAAPPPPALDLRAERKALMTGTADVTVGGGPLPAWKQAQPRRPLKKKQEPAAVPAPAGAADASAMPTKAEFAAMRREVEDFGKKGAEWAHRGVRGFLSLSILYPRLSLCCPPSSFLPFSILSPFSPQASPTWTSGPAPPRRPAT